MYAISPASIFKVLVSTINYCASRKIARRDSTQMSRASPGRLRGVHSNVLPGLKTLFAPYFRSHLLHMANLQTSASFSMFAHARNVHVRANQVGVICELRNALAAGIVVTPDGSRSGRRSRGGLGRGLGRFRKFGWFVAIFYRFFRFLRFFRDPEWRWLVVSASPATAVTGSDHHYHDNNDEKSQLSFVDTQCLSFGQFHMARSVRIIYNKTFISSSQ